MLKYVYLFQENFSALSLPKVQIISMIKSFYCDRGQKKELFILEIVDIADYCVHFVVFFYFFRGYVYWTYFKKEIKYWITAVRN